MSERNRWNAFDGVTHYDAPRPGRERVRRAMTAGFFIAGWLLVAAFGVALFDNDDPSPLLDALVYLSVVVFTAAMLLWAVSG